MIVFDFKPCRFEVHDGYTRTVFHEDSSVNELHVYNLANEEWYLKICEDHGYGRDWRRYSIEHDLTHHWLADFLGEPYSEAIWLGAHGVSIPQEKWHWSLSHEEHLVNSLQRYVRTGEVDAWDWLHRKFGSDENLAEIKSSLLELYGLALPMNRASM